MDRGQRVIAFIENLKHTRGKWAGKRIKLEPWQRDFILALFGTTRINSEEKEVRTYRTAFLFIPRKNGKSQLAAAIALACLLIDGEQGAEIYSAAASREQAALVFMEASRMVRADKTLSKLLKIIDSRKTIIYPATNSFYKAISSDAGNKSGYHASVVIYDELHEAPNRDLWDVLETSQGAREQPLMLAITTAGADKQHSFCGEIYDYACKVRDNPALDLTFLPVIYECPKGADPFSEEAQRAANPNYGVSVLPDYLTEKAAKAKEVPTFYNSYLRYHMNVWVQSDVRWLDESKWKICGATGFDYESLKGKECWCGLDLSATTDVTAFVQMFPIGNQWVVLPHFWLPAESAKKREAHDRVPYLTWARKGHITLTEGDVVDYDKVRAAINQLRNEYQIKEVAVDRWNSTQMQTQLAGDGVSVVTFGQGFASMSAPCKEIEKLVLGQKIIHPNNPVLNWMVANSVAVIDAAGNVKVDRSKSTEKIDGVVAMAMGLGRGLVRSEAKQYAGLLAI